MKIHLTDEAIENLEALKKDSSKARILKDVVKAFELMKINLRHPSLNTHEYKNLKGPRGEKVFEAYAQNNTPGAYRIFWYYGPVEDSLSIFAIVKHP